MPAYVIADIDVHDPDAYGRYAALVPPTLEPFGGTSIVRSFASETLEGDWHPRRLVVLRFPSADHARRWHESEDYKTPKAMRQRASTGSLVLVEGEA